MKKFRVIFSYEIKKVFSKKNLFLYFFLSLLCIYVSQTGINKYKSNLIETEKFINIEKNKTKQFNNYLQYGARGFRVSFSPPPIIYLFFNSSCFLNIKANIDNGEVLNIFNTFKGENLFINKSEGYRDFSDIILLFGSLIALIYGYRTFHDKEQVEYLKVFLVQNQIFLIKTISRGIILLLFFTSLFIQSIVLYLSENSMIFVKEIKFMIFYFIVIIGLSVFFF